VARNLLLEREGVVKAQGASIYILGWAVPLVLFVGAIVWFIDVINDMTPNQAAITYGFLGPILAASKEANGGLATHITEWSVALQHGAGGQISGWVGNVGAGTLAVALMAAATLIGRRVLQKQASAAGRGGGGGRG
jgi:hypothetical protein